MTQQSHLWASVQRNPDANSKRRLGRAQHSVGPRGSRRRPVGGGRGVVRSGMCLGRTRTTRAVTVRVDLESVTLSEITSQEFTYVRHLKLETHEAGRS